MKSKPTTRRSVLKAAAVSSFALPYFFSAATRAQDAKRIVVYGYDGAYGKFQRDYWLTPFEQKFDVKVDTIPVVGATPPLDKLSAQIAAGRPEADVMWVQPTGYIYARNNNMMLPLSKSDLPESVNYLDGYVTEHGPKVSLYAYGIGYNKEMISTPPTRWRDMWDPKLKGRVGLNDALYEQALAMANLAYGRPVTPVDDETFKGLSALRPNIVSLWNTGAQAEQLFRSREIAISPIWNGRVWNLVNEGVPLDFVVPDEGFLVRYNVYGVARNSANPELGAKFINFMMGKTQQLALAEKFFYATANKEVTYPSADIARKVILASPANLAKAKTEDFEAFVKDGADWSRRWNQWKTT